MKQKKLNDFPEFRECVKNYEKLVKQYREMIEEIRVIAQKERNGFSVPKTESKKEVKKIETKKE